MSLKWSFQKENVNIIASILIFKPDTMMHLFSGSMNEFELIVRTWPERYRHCHLYATVCEIKHEPILQ